MFVQLKRSLQNGVLYEYLQIAQSYRKEGKPRQRVLATLGRRDEILTDGSCDALLESMAKFSEKYRALAHGRSMGARSAILARLEEKLSGGAKSLLGNKGYARFLKMAKGSLKINEEAVADADAESGSSTGRPGGVGRKDVSSPNGPSGLGASGVPGGRHAAALAGDDDGMRRMIGVVTKNFSEPVTYGL